MPENIGYQFNRLYAAPIETYRQVNTISQRNSIPPEIRWEGMECYVVAENQDYQLVGGIDNSNWVNAGETVSNPTTHFKGFFNATTVTPALSNLNGIEGDEYKVTNGGVNVDFGAGDVFLETDDIIIFYQSEWRVKVSVKYGFVTPEDYGAAGDGTTDDTAAIVAALASNDKIYLKNSYLVTSTIEVLNNKMIFGLGETSNIITNEDAPVIHIKGYNNSFSNFSIIGSGKDDGLTDQHGILLDGDGSVNSLRKGNLLTNIRFNNLSGSGFRVTVLRGLNFSGGALLTGCFADSCNIGFESASQGEYCCFSNCSAINGNVGVQIQGGNINFVGGQLTNNITNFALVGGSNDAHCTIASCKINHAVEKSISITDVINGYRITNCDIYGGEILIDNSDQIVFDNCFIDFAEIVSGAFDCNITDSNVFFNNNIFITNPENYTETNSTVRYVGNIFKNGIPVGITSYGLPELYYNSLYLHNGTENLEIGVKRTISGTDISAYLAVAGGSGLPYFGTSKGTLLMLGDQENVNGLRYYVGDVTGMSTIFHTANDGFGSELDAGKIGGVTIDNTPVSGNVLKATGDSNAIWGNPEPYLVYTALISQSGTSNPTAEVLRNTLGGTITWTRTGIGVYNATLSVNGFSLNKTFCVAVPSGDTTGMPRIYRSTGTLVILTTGGSDVFTNLNVEIRVYN